jgi:hypothetical protein
MREPAMGGPQHPLYMRGVVADLGMREAERREAGGYVSLVAKPIACLLGGSAVVAKAVCLHDQPELRPVEDDSEAVEVLLGQRSRKASSSDEAQEAPLELGVRQDEGPTVEDTTQGCNAGLAGIGVERGPKRPGIDKLAPICFVDSGLEAVSSQPQSQVEEGADRAGKGDLVLVADVSRGLPLPAMNAHTPWSTVERGT